jgi:hypothetical protein
MRRLVEWPDYDQDGALQFHTVINEPDFLPLHVAQTARLVRAERGRLVATALGKAMRGESAQGSLLALLFHLAFWHIDLEYFGRGLLGSWPQPDIGIVLWSLSVAASDWETSERLARFCTIPKPEMLTGSWESISLRLGSPNSPTTAVVSGCWNTAAKCSQEPI